YDFYKDARCLQIRDSLPQSARWSDQGSRPEEEGGDDGSDGGDNGRPPERGVVAVCDRECVCCSPRERVTREVGGDRGCEDRVQQRRADRGSELLADRYGR